MKRGHQWIHFDAQFPLKFGHDLTVRFGPAGQLLFIHFLCACKRSYPQGQIHYRTEDELRVLLGAYYPFVDEAGDKWTLEEFWRWCGRRKVTSTRVRGGVNSRTYVTATRWNTWEDERNAKQAERMRRSRAESVRARSRLRGEVGKVGKVGGWRGEGGVGGEGEPAVGHRAEKLLTRVDEIQTQAEQRTDVRRNGDGP